MSISHWFNYFYPGEGNLGNQKGFLCIWSYIVFWRWCLFHTLLMQRVWYILVFLCMSFHYDPYPRWVGSWNLLRRRSLWWLETCVGYKQDMIVIQNMNRCFLNRCLIFLCQGSQCFSYYHLWYLHFSFQLVSQVQILLLDFSTDSVVDTHIFNSFFEGCGNFINIIVLFNGFFEDFCCFFYHFGIFWEARCFCFDINQLFRNIFWFIMFF